MMKTAVRPSFFAIIICFVKSFFDTVLLFSLSLPGLIFTTSTMFHGCQPALVMSSQQVPLLSRALCLFNLHSHWSPVMCPACSKCHPWHRTILCRQWHTDSLRAVLKCSAKRSKFFTFQRFAWSLTLTWKEVSAWVSAFGFRAKL